MKHCKRQASSRISVRKLSSSELTRYVPRASDDRMCRLNRLPRIIDKTIYPRRFEQPSNPAVLEQQPRGGS
jgi:hypothetical protein